MPLEKPSEVPQRLRRLVAERKGTMDADDDSDGIELA